MTLLIYYDITYTILFVTNRFIVPEVQICGTLLIGTSIMLKAEAQTSHASVNGTARSALFSEDVREAFVPSRALTGNALSLIRPSDRLKMLVKNRQAFGLDPVFNHDDIKHWFRDMSDTALRVMINRHCAKADVINAVCHGVYQATDLAWSSRKILVAAALKLRGEDSIYLTMHSALPEFDNGQDLLVFITAGRNFMLKSELHGVVAIKHTAMPLTKVRKALVWDPDLSCYKALNQQAIIDYQRHHLGLKSLMREAGVNGELPDISQHGVC
ncbi:MAG: hypothetical protein HLUCCX14_07620 [Marinobacter excellens HL-55]|uniref:Uncharacterized protein n=1 Tax=Marinobacter excellens HL-55 TaxID=1305731 RepID=A0A0P7ZIE8_9GAMM|nr:MAG: hypothetical protein HLUCCX14_07620 [Marinobacter excellens HL-55]